MRTLREAEYRQMPWKNGGGETIEMMVSPAGASFDTFDWRISMAHVSAPGPFSLFPDIDRTLSVIAGDGLSLKEQDGQPVSIDRQSAPFAFSGDLNIDCALIGGPVDDLNIMTRRHRCHHRVSRYSLASAMTLEWQGDAGIVVAIGDSVDVLTGTQNVALASKDALLFDRADSRAFTVTPRNDVDLFLIEIWQLT